MKARRSVIVPLFVSVLAAMTIAIAPSLAFTDEGKPAKQMWAKALQLRTQPQSLHARRWIRWETWVFRCPRHS